MNGSQLSGLIRECTQHVQEKGTRPASLSDGDRLIVALFGWAVKEIKALIAWPLWAIAFGLVVNGAAQVLKGLLGW